MSLRGKTSGASVVTDTAPSTSSFADPALKNAVIAASEVGVPLPSRAATVIEAGVVTTGGVESTWGPGGLVDDWLPPPPQPVNKTAALSNRTLIDTLTPKSKFIVIT